MYTELLLHPEALKGKPIYPDQARKLVAKACDGHAIDPLLFNRDSQGKLIQGVYGESDSGEGWGIPPHVIYGAGKGYIRITGLGAAGSATVKRQAAMVASAVAEHLGGDFSFKLNSGQCGIDRNRPGTYRIRNLCIAKKPAIIKRHETAEGDFTLESTAPLIKRAVIGGIVGQARLLDEEAPAGFSRESLIGTDDMLNLHFHQGQPKFVRTQDAEGGRKGLYALVVSDLVFSIDLSLSGPWACGLLRSKGYGLIRREFAA